MKKNPMSDLVPAFLASGCAGIYLRLYKKLKKRSKPGQFAYWHDKRRHVVSYLPKGRAFGLFMSSLTPGNYGYILTAGRWTHK